MSETSVRNYRDLVVWQRAMDFATLTYRITKTFPREEAYGLTSQARRAASSIAANIAEGYGRATRPAYINHLRIAQGSLKELETHMILAARVELITQKSTEELLAEADQLGRLLNALLKKLARPSYSLLPTP